MKYYDCRVFQKRCSREALQLFQQIQQEGMEWNHIIFASVQTARASLQALEYSKQNHAQPVKIWNRTDVSVGNTLISMYAKCRSMEDAGSFF